MICERPFTKEGMAFPCGTCLPCRYRRRRIWSHRLALESTQHSSTAFVTLTYADDKLPKDGCVSVREAQLFLKRLRKKGYQFRYFLSGEYGEKTLRPHYHLILFGFPQCFRGQTDQKKRVCCKTCEDVKSAWGNGAIEVAYSSPSAMAYVCGYVTKKLTAAPLPSNLVPEFQRMSLKPGLGAGVIHDVANELLKHNLEKAIEDVPTTLQHGKSHFPLGPYLRKRLRRAIGRSEKCPESILEKAKKELQPLREAAFNSSRSFKSEIVQKNKGKIASTLKRAKIYQQRKRI